MTDKEIDDFVKEMKVFLKEISSSKSKSRKFLEETGIYDKNGNLTEHYKSDKKVKNMKEPVKPTKTPLRKVNFSKKNIIGEVPRIKPKKKKESSRFKAAWSKMAYRWDGSFSMTRLMMFFCFTLAGLLLLIGIICGIFGKVLPDNVYDYSFKMSLGGAGQYAITKATEVITKIKGTDGEN